jgi:predicted transport protein
VFTRTNQRHACGAGSTPREVLRNRSESLVRLYESLEEFVKGLGEVEVVARDRYVLFRSVKIFADLVVTIDALRLAVHLDHRADDPIFFKIVSGERAVTHVAKLRVAKDLRAVQPYVRSAYDFSLAKRTVPRPE